MKQKTREAESSRSRFTILDAEDVAYCIKFYVMQMIDEEKATVNQTFGIFLLCCELDNLGAGDALFIGPALSRGGLTPFTFAS